MRVALLSWACVHCVLYECIYRVSGRVRVSGREGCVGEKLALVFSFLFWCAFKSFCNTRLFKFSWGKEESSEIVLFFFSDSPKS